LTKLKIILIGCFLNSCATPVEYDTDYKVWYLDPDKATLRLGEVEIPLGHPQTYDMYCMTEKSLMKAVQHMEACHDQRITR